MARPTLTRIRRAGPRFSSEVGVAPGARAAELQTDDLTWIHVEHPGEPDVNGLAARFGFHELDVEDILSRHQRPKIDEYPNYLFVVLHFPKYDKSIQRLNGAELDMFLGPDFLITLPNEELLPVSRLFARCQTDDELRAELFSNGSGYLLYHVLDDLFDYCFPILDKMGHKLDAIEDEMFEGRSEEIVRDISNAKQEVIAYRKIIKPGRSTLRLLDRQTQRFLPEDLEIYFDDIVDANERVWDILDNYKEVVDALESTNESVISQRQNQVSRILTLIATVILPLTLITSAFGMNVLFPGEGTRAAFWVIIGVLVASVLGMLSFLRWRKLL